MLTERKNGLNGLHELAIDQKVVVLNFLLDTDLGEFFDRNLNGGLDGVIPFAALSELVVVDPLKKPSDSSVRETAIKFVHNCWEGWTSPHKKISHSNGENGRRLIDYDTFINFVFDKVPSNHSRSGPAKWRVVPVSELN